MKQRKRIYYTPEQKTLIWDRYNRGDSLADIAKIFNRGHSSVQPTIYNAGGIRPPVPKRHPDSLTLFEREEISRGLALEHSYRKIARTLSRSPSTISREVNRHGGRKIYRASKADLIRLRGKNQRGRNLVSY